MHRTVEPELQFLHVDANPATGTPARRVAFLRQEPARPGGLGLVWLIGLKSDMVSTKATVLARHCAMRGHGLTRFDYSGHGRSEGDFEQATIGDWLQETRAVFTRLTAGPQLVLGSSTGGHLALLLLRDLMATAPAEAARIKGLLLIAPAWDLTEDLMWAQFDETARREIMENGVWRRPSAYGDEPYAITRRFIEEGRNHLFARRPWNPGRPIEIIHGRLDPDVPLSHSKELIGFLEGGWAKLSEVPDGEHRLSRPQDLALMLDAVDRLATSG